MPGTSVNMSGLAAAQGDKIFGADPGSAVTPPNVCTRDDAQNCSEVSANNFWFRHFYTMTLLQIMSGVTSIS